MKNLSISPKATSKFKRPISLCLTCGLMLMAFTTTSARAQSSGSDLVTRTVNLYFFQDAERVVKDLAGERDTKRIGDASTTAYNDAVKAARDAQVEFETAQAAKVASTQTLQLAKDKVTAASLEVGRLTTLGDAAQATLDARTRDKKNASRSLLAAQRDLQTLNERKAEIEAIPAANRTKSENEELDRLNKKLIPNANDRVTDAQDAENAIEARRAAAETKKSDLNTELGNAKTALDDGKTAQDSATDAVASAETALATSTETARVALAKVDRTARELGEQRAALLKSTGPLVLASKADSNDPLERVQITAETGGVLLLRGTRDDVKKVEEIITQRDQPGAQVRAVFWTLQASGAQTKDALRDLRRSSDDMVFYTRLAQDQVATCGATLRDAILLVYNKKHLIKIPPPSFFQDDVTKYLSFGVGVDAEQRNFQPLNLATFGESAAVIALAKREYREEILDLYFQMLPERLANLEIERSVQAGKMPVLPGKANNERPEWNGLVEHYKATAQFVELRQYAHYSIRSNPKDDTPFGSTKNRPEFRLTAGTDGLTPLQQEVQKFWSGTKPKLWMDMDKKLALVDSRIANLNGPKPKTLNVLWVEKAAVNAREAEKELNIAKEGKDNAKIAEAEKKVIKYKQAVADAALLDMVGLDVANDLTLLKTFREKLWKKAKDLGLNGLYTIPAPPNPPLPLGAPDATDRAINKLEYGRNLRNALDSRAGVAAMDASIRRLMQATERDIEAQFILPSLDKVRKSAAGKGITLGVVERNSVIAMNRTSARVDPRASYEIQLPAKSNLAKDAAQLATFAAGLGAGNAITVLNTASNLRPSSLDDMPGTYSIQSGNAIEFTPIVGPDGQSIRMNVKLSRDDVKQMPNREKGQNFARIERHNVDTDVQDTNFEMIEIARFDNQTSIAENKQRSGGLPILNQIPIIREIPLIGWFTRERKSVVGQQQSLIFMQTAIYPSITDLMKIFDEEGAESN